MDDPAFFPFTESCLSSSTNDYENYVAIRQISLFLLYSVFFFLYVVTYTSAESISLILIGEVNNNLKLKEFHIEFRLFRGAHVFSSRDTDVDKSCKTT